MNPVDKVLFYQGLQAYQDGEMDSAIKSFLGVLSVAPSEWECRFYLAMAYGRAGKTLEAKREFMSVRDLCPEPDLRRKASSAFQLLASPTPPKSDDSNQKIG
jgi:Flp pilus assembly protein TadD